MRTRYNNVVARSFATNELQKLLVAWRIWGKWSACPCVACGEINTALSFSVQIRLMQNCALCLKARERKKHVLPQKRHAADDIRSLDIQIFSDIWMSGYSDMEHADTRKKNFHYLARKSWWSCKFQLSDLKPPMYEKCWKSGGFR